VNKSLGLNIFIGLRLFESAVIIKLVLRWQMYQYCKSQTLWEKLLKVVRLA